MYMYVHHRGIISTMRDLCIAAIKHMATRDRRHPLTPPRAAESTMLRFTPLLHAAEARRHRCAERYTAPPQNHL
jgi:hypothetical protein